MVCVSHLEIAKCLHASANVDFAGVFTHAGHSYRCRSLAGIERVAEDERKAVVNAANRLNAIGIPCHCISVGSTPTALPFDQLTIGSRVRVLPNHACMTAAMYACYHVLDGHNEAVTAIWPRTNGWQRFAPTHELCTS